MKIVEYRLVTASLTEKENDPDGRKFENEIIKYLKNGFETHGPLIAERYVVKRWFKTHYDLQLTQAFVKYGEKDENS